MRHTIERLAILTAVAFALAAAAAAAQPPRGRGMGMPRYDKATETTVSGTVEEVQPHQARAGGMGMGTHLILTTASGPVDVRLGPTNWLESKKYTFTKGDRLEIVGSKVTIDGKKAIIAREIKKGDETIKLRDENGIPAWSRGRRFSG